MSEKKRASKAGSSNGKVVIDKAGVTSESAPRRGFLGRGLFWGLIVGIVLAVGVVILNKD